MQNQNHSISVWNSLSPSPLGAQWLMKKNDSATRVKYLTHLPDVHFIEERKHLPNNEHINPAKLIQYEPTTLEELHKISDSHVGINWGWENKNLIDNKVPLDSETIDILLKLFNRVGLEGIQPETNVEVETEVGLDIKKTVLALGNHVNEKVIEVINKTLENVNDPNIHAVKTINALSDLEALTFDYDTNNNNGQWEAIKKIFKKFKKVLKKNNSRLEDIKKALENIKEQILKNIIVDATLNIFPELEELTLDNDSDSQIEVDKTFNVFTDLEDSNRDNGPYNSDSDLEIAIQTFDEIKIPEKHISGNPNVYAVKTHNVFPDFKNLKSSFIKASFGTDPSPMKKLIQAKIQEMPQAIISVATNESGEQIAACNLPTKETIKKVCEDIDKNSPYDKDKEYEYITGEYNLNEEEDNNKYFLEIRTEGVFYNKVEKKISLSKRQQNICANKSSVNTEFNKEHCLMSKQKSIKEKQLQPNDNEKKGEAEVKETATNGTSKPIDLDTDNLNVGKVELKRKRNKKKKW